MRTNGTERGKKPPQMITGTQTERINPDYSTKSNFLRANPHKRNATTKKAMETRTVFDILENGNYKINDNVNSL